MEASSASVKRVTGGRNHSRVLKVPSQIERVNSVEMLCQYVLSGQVERGTALMGLITAQ